MQSSEYNALHNNPPWGRDRHALPPSLDAKRAQHIMSNGEAVASPSSTHSRHLSSAEAAFNRRTGVDEALVAGARSSRETEYDEEATFIGTCIEIEMIEGDDDDGAPIFRRPNFGGEHIESVDFGVILHAEEPPPRQTKRKASQRMSATFESVVGIGRTIKKRVWSLWPNSSKGRKDSKWTNLDGGAQQQQVEEQQVEEQTTEEQQTEEQDTSSSSEEGLASQQDNNPYRSRWWRPAPRAASLGTSAHWSPCTTGARSTAGASEARWSSPMTRRSATTVASFQVAVMAPLERQSAHVAKPDETVASHNADVSRGSGTPGDARPRGESMVETGYTLAQHLEDAARLGRFDPDRIARRFTREQSGAAQEAAAESPRIDGQSVRGAQEQPNHSAERLIASHRSKDKTKRLSLFRRRKSSHQPSEPRPSVSGGEQQRERSRSTFGAEYARVASIMGASMQQAPVML